MTTHPKPKLLSILITIEVIHRVWIGGKESGASGQKNIPELPTGQWVDTAADFINAAHSTSSSQHHAKLQLALLTAGQSLGLSFSFLCQIHSLNELGNFFARSTSLGAFEAVENVEVFFDSQIIPETPAVRTR